MGTFYTKTLSSHPDYSLVDVYGEGVRLAGKKSITFTVRANNDAHVLLQKDRFDYTNNVVEIVIGGWSNTKSVIRNAVKGTDLVSHTVSALVNIRKDVTV